MNPRCLDGCVGLDRLATQDEVRTAMSFLSPEDLNFVSLRNNFSENHCDSSHRAPNLREEIEWLMTVHKTRDGSDT